MKIAGVNIPDWALYAAAAGVAFYVIKKGSWAAAVEGLAAGAVGVASDTAGGLITGTVKGVGGVVGIPDTDKQKCMACIGKADNLGASKYCTASQFAKWQYLSLRQKLTGQAFVMADIFN